MNVSMTTTVYMYMYQEGDEGLEGTDRLLLTVLLLRKLPLVFSHVNHMPPQNTLIHCTYMYEENQGVGGWLGVGTEHYACTVFSITSSTVSTIEGGVGG